MSAENTLLVKSYEAPPVDFREILRYAGVRAGTDELEASAREAFAIAEDSLVYRVVYRFLPVRRIERGVLVGDILMPSAALAGNLAGCERAVLFAATVGSALDRLLARYAHVSASTALFLQAVGAERIEALCDVFARDIEREAGSLRPRFSPGYGDLPLETQRDIFALLDCPRKIGLTLTDSLLMSPVKSVTAVMGIEKGNKA